MSTKIKYTDEPIEAKVIKDFLPPPEQLAYLLPPVEKSPEINGGEMDKALEKTKEYAAPMSRGKNTACPAYKGEERSRKYRQDAKEVCYCLSFLR